VIPPFLIEYHPDVHPGSILLKTAFMVQLSARLETTPAETMGLVVRGVVAQDVAFSLLSGWLIPI
jgi:hypothetical protein